MYIKAPFRSPGTLRVTQEFGNTSNNAWYKANGVDAPYHNGIDIVFGDAKQTYGTECVCPFETARVVKTTFDTPTSTKGNGVTIETEIGETRYQVVFWHTGELPVKLGQTLKRGDVICYIGNSGLCNPAPTVNAPFQGAHCHLMLMKYTFNGFLWVTNASYINPRELFDFSNWYFGKDTGLMHDMWALTPFAKWQTDIVGYFKRIGLL